MIEGGLLNFTFPEVSQIENGKQEFQKVRMVATECSCDITSTNGVPFNWDGTNSGPVVIKGQHYHSDLQIDYVGFGTTSNDDWIIGNYFKENQDVLWDFCTEFGWLVYNSSNDVESEDSNLPQGQVLKSVRAVVGLDRQNITILLVVDGCERSPFYHQGMTLSDAADLILKQGAKYTIN